MTIAAAIFDCDGVLIDSVSTWHKAEEHVAHIGGLALTAADADYLTTCTVEEAARWFYEDRGVLSSAQEVFDVIDAYMFDFYSTRATAIKGALDYVRGLHEAGVPVAVLSSSSSHLLEAGLGRCGFAPYFDVVVSSEAVGLTKRKPEVFVHTLERLGIDAGDKRAKSCVWMFDDSYYALDAARSVGLRTIGLYSSDKSGTMEQLCESAEAAYRSWSEVPVLV